MAAGRRPHLARPRRQQNQPAGSDLPSCRKLQRDLGGFHSLGEVDDEAVLVTPLIVLPLSERLCEWRNRPVGECSVEPRVSVTNC